MWLDELTMMHTWYVDPWDILNNCCIHVYAQKWVIVTYFHMAICIFDIIRSSNRSCEFRVCRDGSQIKTRNTMYHTDSSNYPSRTVAYLKLQPILETKKKSTFWCFYWLISCALAYWFEIYIYDMVQDHGSISGVMRIHFFTLQL